MPSNHLIFCCPLLFLPSIFPNIKIFSNESVLHIRWPKYWSFSFSISPSSEYSGLISLRIDWFDILSVQGTLKSLFQHHSPKASILQHSTFFYGLTLTSIHDYWKNHSFDCMDFCLQSDVSAVFNPLSSFSSKEKASFNFVAAVTIGIDFGAQENEIWHCFHFFPVSLPWGE